jgi:hypothetical protein
MLMTSAIRSIALATALAATSAMAQEATQVPADANRDGVVSRQEFLDHMGKTWDDRHSRMMRTDPGMKAGMMDHRRYRAFSHEMMGPMTGQPGRSPNPDPGQVGGGTGPVDADADANKDGTVSRQEFIDHMGRSWDDRHTRMMRSNPGMKAGMMDHRQYQAFTHDMMGTMSGTPGRAPNPDPGKIGG